MSRTFYEQSLIDFAWEKLKEARHILAKRGSLRAGLPNAWLYALMYLKRCYHIPLDARGDFDALSNVMCGGLEADPRGGLRFIAGYPDDAIRLAGNAFWKLYAEVAILRSPL